MSRRKTAAELRRWHRKWEAIEAHPYCSLDYCGATLNLTTVESGGRHIVLCGSCAARGRADELTPMEVRNL